MTPTSAADSRFDKAYYESGCGHPYRHEEPWLSFFSGIADRIISDIGARTVLDAGCAIGMMVEGLRARGVEAWGIDISEYAISAAPEGVKPFVAVATLAEPFARRYDLIVCQEVLEHMPRAEGEKAVVNMCAATNDILFSSSPLDYREATHLNAQPVEYWAEQFARQGFFHDVDFDATFISPWAMRLRKGHRTTIELARDFERRWWRLQYENTELRSELSSQRAMIASLKRQVDPTMQDHDRAPGPARQQSAQAQADRGEIAAAGDPSLDEHDAALAENARLKRLIKAYESGRMMRILNRLVRVRQRLSAPFRGPRQP